jgi:hypothetical protein
MVASCTATTLGGATYIDLSFMQVRHSGNEANQKHKNISSILELSGLIPSRFNLSLT